MALDTGLQPVPNYLAAMQSGAGLGLAMRKQDTAESEAAQNLQLAYAHLSATQEAAKQRAQQLAAGNLLRQAHERALLEHYTQMEETANKSANKPVLRTGPNQGIFDVSDPANPKQIVAGKEPVDTDEKALELERNRAQIAADIAKRNKSKFHATVPVESGTDIPGLRSVFPKKTTQKPIFGKPDIQKADAAADAANQLLEEKNTLLEQYKKSKRKAGGVTHKFNLQTGELEPVNE